MNKNSFYMQIKMIYAVYIYVLYFIGDTVFGIFFEKT